MCMEGWVGWDLGVSLGVTPHHMLKKVDMGEHMWPKVEAGGVTNTSCLRDLNSKP